MRTKRFLIWLAIAALAWTGILWATETVAQSSRPSLTTASYGWRPFIYEEIANGIKSVRGLDARLADLAFSRMGYDLVYEPEESWGELLDDVKAGRKDVVISALKKTEREKFAHYSDVFRSSVNVLYVRKGSSSEYDLASVPELLNMFREKSFRLGIVEGYSYGDADVDSYINQAKSSNLILEINSDAGLFTAIEQNLIDGFLVDQIVGADISYERNLEGLPAVAEEYPLRISELPYYVIFSKNTVTSKVVEKFNQSIDALQKSGEYNQLVQQYLFPVLLDFTTGQKWYFIVELTGVISFSISGLVLANREGYDLFGAFVLAALPGVGGGILRDIVAGRTTIGVMKAPTYMIVVIITVVVGYLLIQLQGWWQQRIGPSLTHRGDISGQLSPEPSFITILRRQKRRLSKYINFNSAIELFDALGLSTLSIIGVIVALEVQSSPLWLWGPIFAAITSAGGGILRDMVRSDGTNASLKGTFYPIIAIIWGLFFSLFIVWYSNQLNYYPSEIFTAVMVVIFGSFATRILAILFKLKMPLFSYKPIDFHTGVTKIFKPVND